MKFAVIGCGSIGTRHISNLLKLGHETVAYNRGQFRRDNVADHFGIPTYDCINDMLNKCNPDAVLICSPNSLHKHHLNMVVKKGLHFFVEKPLASESDGLDKLEVVVDKKELISHVGSNMRFHFGPKTVKHFIDSGQIGNPIWANLWGGMHLPDWHPSEDYRDMYSASKNLGGGAVLDFIHEIDLNHWLFGDPEILAARVSNSGWLDIETEDVVDVILGYKNGPQVNIHLDYLQRPFQRGIHVVGDRGSVKWDLERENIVFIEHQTKEKHTINYPSGYNHNDMYISQMEYFVGCLEKKRPSFSGFSDGLRALRTALNIKKSSSTKQFIRGKNL
tara:strand:- start:887 stop:1885 length:999 start_codon:yes stop_codon:yes gene_type:complete